MKKAISALLALIIAVSFSGCDSVEDNFNYENANIIENVPSSGKWQRLSFPFQRMCRESSERILRFAENYGVSGIKEDDLILSFNGLIEEGHEFAPLSEYDEHITSDEYSEYPYAAMFYCSDEFYIEVQSATGGMIELDNRKNVNSILELDYNYKSSWRPHFRAADRTVVDMNDENVTCVLDGKTVKITDAIKNAEKYVEENDVLFPKEWAAKALDRVELCTFENGNQSLMFNIGYTIDNVPLDSSQDTIAVEDEDGNTYDALPIYVQCGMLTENTLDWIWFSAIDGGTEFTSEDCEIKVTREEACELIAKKLSQEYEFYAEEIQLMYATKRVGDGSSAVIEPMWRFYVTGVRSQEYSNLYVYVSAVDGEIQIRATV